MLTTRNVKYFVKQISWGSENCVPCALFPPRNNEIRESFHLRKFQPVSAYSACICVSIQNNSNSILMQQLLSLPSIPKLSNTCRTIQLFPWSCWQAGESQHSRQTGSISLYICKSTVATVNALHDSNFRSTQCS